MFYLLFFGGIIWFYQNNSTFQEQFNIGIHNAQVFTQSWLHRITGKEVATPTMQSTDQQADTQDTPTDARWQQNSATIYIDIKNPVLKNATETAITQWNNTAAFTFKVVNDKNANITVSAVNDPNNGAAGLTNTSMNSATGYYLHATVELNSYYLLNPAFGYSQERIVNTAEHELGHAIGLQHTDKTSVMQPAGSYYPIQPRDIQAVKALYSSTPHPVIVEGNTNK